MSSQINHKNKGGPTSSLSYFRKKKGISLILRHYNHYYYERNTDRETVYGNIRTSETSECRPLPPFVIVVKVRGLVYLRQSTSSETGLKRMVK